jgi:hypothetical protein
MNIGPLYINDFKNNSKFSIRQQRQTKDRTILHIIVLYSLIMCGDESFGGTFFRLCVFNLVHTD